MTLGRTPAGSSGNDHSHLNGNDPSHSGKRTRKAAVLADWRAKNPERMLVALARTRAKRSGLPCSVTPSDIHIPDVCPILGRPLKRVPVRGGGGPDSPSLDRLDPALGYIPGNVRVISYRANRMKSDGTAEEHEAIARWMRAESCLGT